MNRRQTLRRFAGVIFPAGANEIAGSIAPESLNAIKMTRPNQVVRAVGMGRLNVPNCTVTDQDGKSYRFYEDLVKGKMVLINMFYANCTGICPRMTSRLASVQKELMADMGDRMGKDLFIYSISMKPEEDTQSRLKHYTQMHGIKPQAGWLLLRAERPDMELLRERLGFKESDVLLDSDINQHTGMVRYGSDVYDKWSSAPLLGPTDAIIQGLRWTDLSLARRGLDR
ncbi:MAG TPA: SCO family protein [Bryobacteraceae bacterium]|nr:SCO family protein [Bryobacteraceae bacterium]